MQRLSAMALSRRLALMSAMASVAGARRGAADDLGLLGAELAIAAPDQAPWPLVRLSEAMRRLHIPSVGLSLIEGGGVVWSRTVGGAADQPYQAASLTKLVTAVTALRLVRAGTLSLDGNINTFLRGWRLPSASGAVVTLRELLTMTAGIGVPGFAGYAPGEPLPTLAQILDGTPPATSPTIRATGAPGTYAYSGGGYQIIQAMIEGAARLPFAEIVRKEVFEPVGMSDSSFEQPPSHNLAVRAARGHFADGRQLPGGWRVVPELAAGGMWSTPSDIARLLVALVSAWRGDADRLLKRDMARHLFTRQGGGPYGLGAAVAGLGRDLVLMKRGQNVGYQSYLLVFPETGQGIVVMTGSDNGTTLATALIRRAAAVYSWPELGELLD